MIKEVILCDINNEVDKKNIHKTYIKMLKEANIKIIDFIKNIDNCDKYKDIYLIDLSLREDGFLDFNDSFFNILNKIKNKNIKILHPVFIVEYIKLNFNKRNIVFGFPGSGNMLLINIINELSKERKTFDELIQDYSLKEVIVQYLVEHHFNFIRQNLYKYFNEKDLYVLYRYEANLNENQSVFITIDDKKGNFLDIKNIKTKSYLIFENTICHSFANFLPLVKSKNYNTFLALRNPLDAMFSYINKIDYMMIQTEKYSYLNENKIHAKRLQNIVTEIFMNDLRYFRETLKMIKNYLSGFINQDMIFIRHEDLTTNPTQTIKKIANILNTSLSDNKAKDIWDKYGFKLLDKYNKTHLNEPNKQNKWLPYITDKHFEILEELDFFEFMKNFGYSIDIDKTKLKKYHLLDIKVDEYVIYYLSNFIAKRNFHKNGRIDTTLPYYKEILKTINFDIFEEQLNNIKIISPSKELLNKTKEVLTNCELQKAITTINIDNNYINNEFL